MRSVTDKVSLRRERELARRRFRQKLKQRLMSSLWCSLTSASPASERENLALLGFTQPSLLPGSILDHLLVTFFLCYFSFVIQLFQTEEQLLGRKGLPLFYFPGGFYYTWGYKLPVFLFQRKKCFFFSGRTSFCLVRVQETLNINLFYKNIVKLVFMTKNSSPLPKTFMQVFNPLPTTTQ